MNDMLRDASTFEDEFLTTRQVADALKKNLGTIQRWCREGKIPAARIEGTYIIRKQDFENWYRFKLTSAKPSVGK